MADNRKMWESLGMDLETHDMLCEVLPVAFGDVYLSQENRPECVDFPEGCRPVAGQHRV